VLQSYGVTAEASTPIVEAFRERPKAWVDFMMRFELGLEKPDPHRALVSALTIAGAYIAGGFIPWDPISSPAAPRRHSPFRWRSRSRPWRCSATSKATSPAPRRCVADCRPY